MWKHRARKSLDSKQLGIKYHWKKIVFPYDLARTQHFYTIAIFLLHFNFLHSIISVCLGGFSVAYYGKQEEWPKYTSLESKQATWFAACKHYTEELICLQSITPNSVQCALCCLCSNSVQIASLLSFRYSTQKHIASNVNFPDEKKIAKWETVIP